MFSRRHLVTLVFGFIIIVSLGSVVCADQRQPQDIVPTPHRYAVFLESLPQNDIESIHKAIAEFKTLAGTDPAENNLMFLAFRAFYYSVLQKTNDNLYAEETKISDFDNAALRRNGLRIMDFDAGSGRCFGQRPAFFCTEFQGYLSGSLNEYNLIHKAELLETGDEEKGLYLFDDLGMMITWDQLADRIVKWETYLAKYPQSPLKNTVESAIRIYINVYTTGSGLESTPAYRSGLLRDKVKASYKRFIKHYPESQFHSLIKEYFTLLRQQRFSLTPEIIDFLRQNGIDTRFLKITEKR